MVLRRVTNYQTIGVTMTYCRGMRNTIYTYIIVDYFSYPLLLYISKKKNNNLESYPCFQRITKDFPSIEQFKALNDFLNRCRVINLISPFAIE